MTTKTTTENVGNVPADKRETTGLQNQSGSNITKLKEDIQKGVQKINGFIDDRTNANQNIAAVKSDLEAKGVHKKALNMAMTYMNMDPDKREGFDIAYGIVREALGAPVGDQSEMNLGDDQDG